MAVWVPSVTVRVPPLALPLKVASPAETKPMSSRSRLVVPAWEKPLGHRRPGRGRADPRRLRRGRRRCPAARRPAAGWPVPDGGPPPGGWLRAVLAQVVDLLDPDALTVTGRPLVDHLADAPIWDTEVIRERGRPLLPDAGIAVLWGNLAPDGAVIKPAAASADLLPAPRPRRGVRHVEDLHARIDDPDLDVDADSVLVLRGCGPRGYPGMPEVANLPLPRQAARSRGPGHGADLRRPDEWHGVRHRRAARRARGRGGWSARAGPHRRLVVLDVPSAPPGPRRPRRRARPATPSEATVAAYARPTPRLGAALRRPRAAGRHRRRPRLPARAPAATGVSRESHSMATGELDGLVAAVTGGGSGIGAAVVRLLQADGARVALDLEPGDLAPEDATAGRLALRTDVTDDASVRAAVDRPLASRRRLDVLVNCAGIGAQGTVADNDDAEWRQVFDVNLLGRGADHPGGAAGAAPSPARPSSPPARSSPPPACRSARCTAPPRARCSPDPRDGRRPPGGGHPGQLRQPRDGGHPVDRPAAGRGPTTRPRNGPHWRPGSRTAGW